MSGPVAEAEGMTPAAATTEAVPATALPADALIILPVRNMVLFPGLIAPLTLGRPATELNRVIDHCPLTSSQTAGEFESVSLGNTSDRAGVRTANGWPVACADSRADSSRPAAPAAAANVRTM